MLQFSLLLLSGLLLGKSLSGFGAYLLAIFVLTSLLNVVAQPLSRRFQSQAEQAWEKHDQRLRQKLESELR